jgi:hypothetical protein
MKARENIGSCAGGIRHWFTVYGAVGAPRAICGHCRMPHPNIQKALQRGLMYARLYGPPEDAETYEKALREQQRDIALIEEAIERIANERDAVRR